MKSENLLIAHKKKSLNLVSRIVAQRKVDGIEKVKNSEKKDREDLGRDSSSLRLENIVFHVAFPFPKLEVIMQFCNNKSCLYSETVKVWFKWYISLRHVNSKNLMVAHPTPTQERINSMFLSLSTEVTRKHFLTYRESLNR